MKNEFSNTNSKDIWDNHLLCAQFLRDYTGIPLLERVQPEDITDEAENLRPFLGMEFEGDAIKKVRIHLSGDIPPTQKSDFTGETKTAAETEVSQEIPVYVVALLEHKSSVDYDVTFQLLKYMVGIWTLHRNERNNEDKGASNTQHFRYPLVIPIVYYEGRQKWTADMHWRDRVELSTMFAEYVPDFTYKVVNLHGYSNTELLSKEDEISLIMMLNRVQSAEDLDISQWSAEYRETAQRIIQKAPDAVLQLLAQMIHHFGLRLNVPEDTLKQCVRNVEEKAMGELWANMEVIDIQAAWKDTAEARKERDKALAERDDALAECDNMRRLLAETQETDARIIENLRAEIERLKKK